MLLIHHDPDGVVQGLEEFPVDERPPVNVVHLAYNAMVGLGTALLLLSAWFGWSWWRRRRIPDTPWFLRAVAVSGVAAVVAMEAGWITTEVGPPAVDRLRDHSHRRRGQPRPRPLLRPLCRPRHLPRAHRADGVRPAAVGQAA